MRDIALNNWHAAARINNISDREQRIAVARWILYSKRVYVELGWMGPVTTSIRADILLLTDYIKEMETT